MHTLCSKKVKVEYAIPHEECTCRRGANLLFSGREPVVGKSVTNRQRDARPTVAFPAAGHHRPLTGTELYCL